jgi:hypothetical protein
VLFEDGEGCVRSLPTAWTTVAVADPFVVLSAGRSFFRVEDLLSLVPLVKGLSTSHRIRGDREVGEGALSPKAQRHSGPDGRICGG